MNILLLLPRVMQKDIHFTYKSKFTIHPTYSGNHAEIVSGSDGRAA